MKVVFSPECLGYSRPGHPESPERVAKSHSLLKESFAVVPPGQCRESDLLLVHTERLVEEVKREDFEDPDMISFPGVYNAALLSCGAAIKAMELCLKKEAAFSLMRPPGHHAGRDFFGGFCYFNNIAVASRVAMERHGIKKVAVLDIDCHHGNGTQDIFLGNNSVLYISLHQSPLYPGTGKTSEKNCINYPLPLGTNGNRYLDVFKKAAEKAKEFSPEMIAVSAGFDAYRKDPITDMNLDIETYKKISEIISGLKAPAFAILEGGYSKDLPFCIKAFLEGFG